MVTRPTGNAVLFFTGILAVLLVGGLSAQAFRGEVVVNSAIETEPISAQLATGQVVLVRVAPESRRFVDALVVELAPESGSVPAGAFSIAVYGGVDPPTEEGFTNLAGALLGSVPLGSGVRQRIVVPFREGTVGAVSAGVAVTEQADFNTGAVGLQLVPVSKGIDSGTAAAEFSLAITPELRPVGGIRVTLGGDTSIREEARAALQLSFDGEPLDLDSVYEAAPGIYRLTARAGDYLDYTSNVGIDRGRIREIVLEAREPRAVVRLTVPSVAEVYWNGSPVNRRQQLEVEPGRHDVMIRVGDYSVSRRVTLEANETYEVGISLDILLNRD